MDNEEGLQRANKKLQTAAGIFTLLKDRVVGAIEQVHLLRVAGSVSIVDNIYLPGADARPGAGDPVRDLVALPGPGPGAGRTKGSEGQDEGKKNN